MSEHYYAVRLNALPRVPPLTRATSPARRTDAGRTPTRTPPQGYAATVRPPRSPAATLGESGPFRLMAPREALAFDFGCAASYSCDMGRSRALLAWVLTTAVSAASVACACAVPEFASSDAEHRHHMVGHHAEDITGGDDCLHVDCGDCSADGLTSRSSASSLPAEVSLDEAVALAGGHLFLAPGLRASSCRSPPLPLARLADSPVRRFDKMLD